MIKRCKDCPSFLKMTNYMRCMLALRYFGRCHDFASVCIPDWCPLPKMNQKVNLKSKRGDIMIRR